MSTVGTQIPGSVEVRPVDADPQPNASFLQLAMTALRLTTSAAANVTKNASISDRNNNNTVRHRKQYTLDEVSYHDTFGDCWIVLYDRVYDISNFLQVHPGGHDVLMEHAGRDATIAFTGHSQAAIASLQLYEIGELPPHECIYRCIGKLSATIMPD
ncbi:hypothetical protein pipiens_015113 [Culex pipiens pipiens]|uniref:Cytochrome b5 heme-binding domain-containing protein n=1 Tax=Culex pipiens pipiens TaxID=38569 RepID=A0ABD1CRU7_CULPP